MAIKVLFFYQYFGTPKGSWSTRVYELSRRWVAAGHKVTVVTAPYEKSDLRAKGFISRQEIEGINLIVINSGDSNRLSILHRGVRALCFSLAAIYFALAERYDIAIASSGPITIGLPMIVAKKIRQKKTVFEVRDLWPEGGIAMGIIKDTTLKNLSWWFEKICYRHSDLIIPCSKGMEDAIITRYPDLNTVVIPNASDVKLFGSQNKEINQSLPEWTKGKKIFVYAGSIGLMNDCEQIIKAMQLVKRDDVIIVLFGDGNDKKRLERYAAENHLNHVFFFGLKPKTEVVRWLKKATASIIVFKDIPVLNTSSPNRLFDAFAAGVPVLQNTSGWIYQLIEQENCGINFSPNRPDQLASAIIRLVEDKELRDNMAMNARRLAVTQFNRDHLAVKYLNAITKVTGLDKTTSHSSQY